MSTPVTTQPRRASGIAVLPVPQATSSTRAPAGMLRLLAKASPPPAIVLATMPKSPAIQVLRMESLICCIGGVAGVDIRFPPQEEVDVSMLDRSTPRQG